MIKFEIKPLDTGHGLYIFAIPEGKLIGFNTAIVFKKDIDLESLSMILKSSLSAIMNSIDKEYGNEKEKLSPLDL